jgi:microcin C transport system ATP-binding protein
MKLPLLQVRGLSIAFGENQVVHDVSFNIQHSERVALVGESGSGKSVTALSLTQLAPGVRLSGRCLLMHQDQELTSQRAIEDVDTVDLVKLSPKALQRIRGADIAYVFQEPMTALNPLFTVGDQIAEVLQIKRAMLPDEAWYEAVNLLVETGIDQPVARMKAYPHQLSGGQRQRVLIAMALAAQPRLLVADEPTTALDVSLREQILDLLIRLQESRGMAVLLITHDLASVKRFAQRVMVMEKGQLVEEGATDQVLSTPAHPYTQRLLDSLPVRDVVTPRADAPIRVQASALQVRYPVKKTGFKSWFQRTYFDAVRGVDFVLRAGQTLGVIGESGSGKSTLALASLGLLPHEGLMSVDGTVWSGQAKKDLDLRRKVQVVFQDPFGSLSPRMTVQDIVCEGLDLHCPEMDKLQRLRKLLKTLAAVGLTESQFPNLLQRYAHEFSGGQRQRLAIARALMVDPEVLVLDEPTSALDVSTQRQILGLLQNLQKERGLSYLLITHDVAVVRAMAHHIMVLKGGQVVETGAWEQVSGAPAHPYTQVLLASARSLSAI